MRLKVKIWLLVILAITVSVGYGRIRYDYGSQIVNPVSSTFHFRWSPIDHSNRSKTGSLIGSQQLMEEKQSVPSMKLAKSVVAMDARTGKIIYNRNGNQPRKVASVAKLMTLFLVEQRANHLHHGWQQIVNTSSPQLRKMGKSKSLGGFDFKPHYHYTVRELFKAALIESSNNAAIALGQWVAGSNAKFIKMMNAQARAWHLKARFVSASGLENDDLKRYRLVVSSGKKAGNLISAKSVAVIAQHLLAKYPSVLQDSKKSQDRVTGQRLNNVNELLPGKSYAKKDLKVDGLKTGFTPDAGYCFVGTERGHHQDRIITVVLHDAKEFPDTRDLMEFISKNDHSLNH